MRKTSINPKMIAATLAMMALVNAVTPATVYAAEDDNEIQIEQQAESYEVPDDNSGSQQEEVTEEREEQAVESSSEVTEEETETESDEESEDETEIDQEEDKESDEESDTETEEDNNDDKEEDKEDNKDEKKDKDDIMKTVTELVSPVVNDAISGKLENSSQVIDKITINTIKYVNDNFIKSLPYIGNIVSSLISNSLAEEPKEDNLNKRLESIIDKIDMINKTIIESTNKITHQQEKILQNDKIKLMNDLYNKLVQGYKVNRESFENAMLTIGEDDTSRHRASNLKEAYGLLDKIYDPTTVGLYDTYMEYCKAIMSGTDQVSQFSEFNPNIFGAFHAVTLCDKNGKYAAVQFQDENRKLIKQVTNTCEYGYAMLHSVIETQLTNQEALLKAYEQSRDELTKQLDNVSGDQKEIIEDTLNDLKNKIRTGTTRLKSLRLQKEEIEKTKSAVDKFIGHELDTLNETEHQYELHSPYTSVHYFYKDYGIETTKDGTKAYPKISKDEKSIEYRDCYGNYCGTRTIEDGYKKVNQYKIEVGKTYRIEISSNIVKFCGWVLRESTDPQDVKITRVYEQPMLIGSCRMVEGIDVKTNKLHTFSIGDGVCTVYEKVVGDFIESKEPANK